MCSDCLAALDFSLEGDLRGLLWGDGQRVYLDGLWALLTYDKLAKKLLHHYKYLGTRDLSEYFGHWLDEFASVPEVDLVTFIPIHRRRMAERGYNQAAEIAKRWAAARNVPCRALLRRTVHRSKQAASRDEAERRAKTRGIFAPVEADVDKNCTVLLIDDVVTTGSTFNEAARILKKAGYKRVYGLALAHGD